MSRQISEQGGDAALQKRIRQAVYDIRYKARKDELDLRHAYSQYIGKSGLDQTGKEAVQNKLFGKSQQAESNVLEAASSNKYKVRVSDNETGKTYIRYAKRDKISKLRSKGSVEMTGHGSPKGAKNAPSVKKDPKKKLKSAGPAPKKVALSKKKPGVVALPKKAKPVQVQVVDPKKMEKNETDVVGSAVKSLRKIVRKEAFIADATAVAPPVNKKITGEKVDNTKLIKVFPQDGSDPQIGSIKSSYKPVGEVVAEIVNPQQVDEVVGQVVGGLLGATAGKGLAAKGLAKVAGAATKAGAPAAVAKALTSKAAPKIAGAALGSAAGEVLDPFKKNKDKNPVAAAAGGAAGGAVHGAIKSSYKPVGQVVAEILANEDMNKGYEVTNADKKGNTPAWQGYLAGKKKKDGTPLYRKAAHMEEEVGVSTSAAMEKAKKEAKLQSKERGAVKKAKRWQDNDGDGKWYEKGVDVKKEEFVDPFYKQVEYDDDDPRSMKTKWNLVKNRLRSLGLKCSNELEGDTIEEGSKLKSGVGSAVGKFAGGALGATAGIAAGGGMKGAVVGGALGATAGSAAGAALGAKKGRKGSAAVGGAVGGPVGAAIGASNELEGDTLAEDEAIREARRADKMGIARKKVTYDKGEETRNPNPDRGAAPSFKPEGGSRAGSIAKSRARSLGDARRKANRKGANLAYGKREGRLATFAANKRDSDSDLGSQKAVTDTGAHKDKQGFRQVHKYGERGDKRRPSYNPKHTANTQKEHHQVDAKGKVIEHGDGTPSSIEESKGYVCESTLVRNILTKKN
tara:strand:- start:617 stop:2998 length:2382 start_codon:yes stop_codon:yes gene_type:complete